MIEVQMFNFNLRVLQNKLNALFHKCKANRAEWHHFKCIAIHLLTLTQFRKQCIPDRLAGGCRRLMSSEIGHKDGAAPKAPYGCFGCCKCYWLDCIFLLFSLWAVVRNEMQTRNRDSFPSFHSQKPNSVQTFQSHNWHCSSLVNTLVANWRREWRGHVLQWVNKSCFKSLI